MPNPLKRKFDDEDDEDDTVSLKQTEYSGRHC